MAYGIGLLVLLCAFIPGGGRPRKELDFGVIKLLIYRPVVFACGALLAGVGSLTVGVLSLAERIS